MIKTSFCLVFCIFIGLPLEALANIPFAQRQKPKFDISTYQPPLGWFESLRKIDGLNHINFREDWFPFREADIWIYFLKDEDEISDIGGGVNNLYRSTFESGSVTPLSRRMDIALDSGRKIMILFFFAVAVENGKNHKHEFSCKTSFVAMKEISGLPLNVSLEEVLSSCSTE